MNTTPNDNHASRSNRTDLDVLLDRLPADEATRLRGVWELAGAHDPTAEPSPAEVEQALARLEARLDRTDRAALAPAVRRAGRRRANAGRQARGPTAARSSRRAVWSTVAVALVLAGLALAWWRLPVTRFAPPGERVVLQLPDGSRVELNAGSRLRYARGFGGVRRVHLRGEAFFDVKHSDVRYSDVRYSDVRHSDVRHGERPFVVETFNAEVRVLGTRFAVRAWPAEDDPSTRVALVRGRVALAPAQKPERAVELQPGETARVGAMGVDLFGPGEVSVDDATAWLQGDLIFKDQQLGVVLGEVGRRFGVTLTVRQDTLRRRRLNLALRRPANAEVVVRDLALALGLRYRPTATGFELYPGVD